MGGEKAGKSKLKLHSDQLRLKMAELFNNKVRSITDTFIAKLRFRPS